MSELGNILFDRCGGGYEVPRGAGFEEEFYRLFESVDPERDKSWRDYGPSFENATFQIWPYSWCDCDCGYDEKEHVWSQANHHRPDCYQTRRDRYVEEWKAMNDYEAIEKASYCDVVEESEEEIFIPGLVMHTTRSSRSAKADEAHGQWCKLHTELTKVEGRVSKSLCKELGIIWNGGRGSAVHCTCDYGKRWSNFRESNTHDLCCQVERKSFLYKPEGFYVDWYKYPLRDAHSSRSITLQDFGKIVDACIVTLATDKGGPIVTLESIRKAEAV